jgi:uncharacterized protein (DUF2147 family)
MMKVAVMPFDPIVAAAAALAAIVLQPGPVDPQGQWRNPQGSVIVTIAPCGEALCGVVNWASDSAKADARRGGTDQLVGTEVLSQFSPHASGRWRGRLFVPDLNKRPKAEMRLVGSDQLKVTVCGAAGLLCKSQLWVRADQP